MTLPSQSARPIARGSNMFRRKRRTKRRPTTLFVVLAAAGVIALAWKFWPSGAEANEASPEGAQLTLNESTGGEDQPTGRGASDRETQRSRAGQGPVGNATPPSDFAAPSERSSDDEASPSPSSSSSSSSSSSRDADLAMGRRGNQTPGVPGGDAPARTQPVDDTPGGSAPDTGGSTGSEPTRASKQRAEPIGSARGIQQMRLGLEQVSANKPVEARRTLTDALRSGDLNRAQADRVRRVLKKVNDKLVFSPLVIPGDPFAERYTLRAGDSLSKVVNRLGLQVDWRFLQRINEISDPRRIRAGQQIKYITGPFHAMIDKRDYRLDLYMGEGSEQVFVRSFRVGLGQYGSTPVGEFRVARDSRLINPEWVNPRTREKYLPDDPENPIGERWVGLEGVDERTKDLQGYGIHGTIEPDTIGSDASMGCVRMLPDDVAIVFEVLLPEVSRVEIR